MREQIKEEVMRKAGSSGERGKERKRKRDEEEDGGRLEGDIKRYPYN